VQAGAINGGEVRGGRRTARDSVARVEEGSKEGNRAGIGEGTTRGRRRSRRWRSGGGRAVAVREEEEEREGVRGAYLEISETSGTSR
jgi:hypothetical protein